MQAPAVLPSREHHFDEEELFVTVTVTRLDIGKSVASLERLARAAYKRRCETMAAFHEAHAAMWRKPSVTAQEALDNTRREARAALSAYNKARAEADQARRVVEAA